MDENKPCLKCTIKHILNSKTYLMEAKQFGSNLTVEIEDINKLIMTLAKYVLDKKGEISNGN